MFRFADSKDDFDTMRDEAIANKGLVMPGLAEKEVNVVSVPKHDFDSTWKEALQKAEAWAKRNIVGTHRATDSEGKEFEYSIVNKTVGKYVSDFYRQKRKCWCSLIGVKEIAGGDSKQH